MTISVIANFYKSEKFIPKLIKSVLAQSFTDWELICVNDCSPGNDLQVLSRFAQADRRIRIVNNKVNLGICKAKYRGLQEARGKYLCFIDGDDWLEPDALKRMVEPALTYDLDMVIMNHKKVLPLFGYSRIHKSDVDNWNSVIKLDPHPESGNERQNFVEFIGNFFGKSIYAPAYWGKLIKKEAITQSGFTPPENYIAEDFVFNLTIFPFLRKIMFVDYVGYNWRWGGITSGKKDGIWTAKNNIRRSNEIYVDRLRLINRYGLQSYATSLMTEQRNNFEGYISSIAKEDINSQRAHSVISVLDEVLKEKFYDDFTILLDSDAMRSCDELLMRIINRDARGVYVYCHEVYRRTASRRALKRILHKILYLLT